MSSGPKNFFATSLLQLQNQIKRDPSSYKDEFLQTYHNYESVLQVYLMKPTKPNKQLADLTLFLAHVSHCFPEELKNYPQQLIDLLKKYATVLNPDTRMSLCRCLMLMRSKSLIEPVALFQTFFSLMKCQDKALRKFLYTYMLNEAKRIKTKLKNYKILSQVQQHVFTLTKDLHPQVAKYAILLLTELYRKQVWNDAKTVNVIANGCFTKITKVITIALQFFSGKDQETESDKESDSDDDEKKTAQQVLLGLRVGKKTNKRKKKSDRALKAIKRDKKSKKKSNGLPHFSALNLIYDPQDFAEKLFKLVETTNEGFELKLSILDLISRLIGVHSLYLNNYHTFLLKFLNPHQREVPKILWFTAISSHDLTPPDTVEPVLMAIANNFITERNNNEVIAVGLNAIREICSRCPLAMNEDLLGDLVQYSTYKDKAVISAAKSLIQLFRTINPQMLHKRMRGKPTEETYEELTKVKRYGEIDAKSYVPGAEIIDNEPEDEKTVEKNKEEDEWEECSNESGDEDEGEADEVKKPKTKKRKHSEDDDEDDEGEWVDVSDDDINPEDLKTEDNAVSKMTLEEKEKRASQVSSDRIFTQEDFKKIRIEQLKKKVTDKNFTKGKNKKNVSIDTDSEDEEALAKRDGLVPLSSITHINKKKDHDKEARIESIKKGREDRGKFGHRFKDSKLGKTNKEKLKSKSFQMVRHKINKKFKRSFKDKQIALRNSLLKQKKLS